MKERIYEILTQNNITNEQKELLPITTGAGGANVFTVADKYVVKYINLSTLNAGTRKQYQKEFDFYRIDANKKIDFIPEIIFQATDDDEIIIVMKKYIPIKTEEWDVNLQTAAAEICAKINALNIVDYIKIIQNPEADNGNIKDEDPHPLSLSYQNWTNLQKKFPGNIDATLLEEMYNNYKNKIDTSKFNIPETLKHGDFHPQNFLKNGEKLIICDWQGVCMGKGIGDIAFFISRGTDMGLKINRDKLISDYNEALIQHTNIETSLTDLHKTVAANEFGVSFKFWAEYLQDADINKVLNIYTKMVESYTKLR